MADRLEDEQFSIKRAIMSQKVTLALKNLNFSKKRPSINPQFQGRFCFMPFVFFKTLQDNLLFHLLYPLGQGVGG